MKLLTTATAALLVLGTTAFAQDVPERPSRMSETNMFERLDADDSGAVTLEEFESAKQKLEKHGRGEKMSPQRMMDRLDQNDDKMVSPNEWGAVRDKMDQKQGKKPTREEMAGRAFDRLDENKDGVLSREEFIAGAGKMQNHRHGMYKPGVHKPGMEKPGMQKPGQKPIYKKDQVKE